MDAKEVENLLREYAIALIDLARKTEQIEVDNLDLADMKDWCLYLLDALAESKWATADIIESLANGKNLNFEKVSKTKKPEPLKIGSIYSEPPFDKTFFLQHDDID